MLVPLMAVQAKFSPALLSSTRDAIKRIEKLKTTDDILRTFDLIVTDFLEQKQLSEAWSIVPLFLAGGYPP